MRRFKGRDAQFVVFNPYHDFIANIDPQRLAKGGGNDDAAILIDPGSGFVMNGHMCQSVT